MFRPVMLIALVGSVALGSAQPATQAVAPEAPLAWLASVPEAYRQALDKRQPILVVIGAQWCGVCRALEQEIDKPLVQAKLSRWTRVRLDVDKHAEAMDLLGGPGGLPALRILAPTGGVVSSKTGLMSADELIQWLDANHAKATAAIAEELIGSGEPDAQAIGKLIEHLSASDAALREAALRRLQPYPQAAAAPVVEAFIQGKLATRLSALDLLAEWKAPVVQLDPWNPATFTEPRLAALKAWAARPRQGPSTQPAQPTPAELDEIRRQLNALVAAPTEPEARALRERLARRGSALRSQIQTYLRQSPTDQASQRLTALRYRLVASNAVALDWPGGLERLASTDVQVRHKAVGELAARATAVDAALLLELFGDPDPLVRELSLQTLQKVSGAEAAGALTRLLQDPDPNVRAAVLKQFAQTPPGDAVLKQVIAYAQQEKDADLVVHAVRVLRTAQHSASMEALMKLLEHPSWRVRAEAVEAIQEFISNRNQASARADVYTAMIGLLDDPDAFVASRAAAALQRADTVLAVEPLVKAAEKHPQVAPEIIAALAQGSQMRKAALPHLRKFLTHASAPIRTAAIEALADVEEGGLEQEFAAALKDADAKVRAAAAKAVFSAIERLRPRGGMQRRVESSFFGLRQRVIEEPMNAHQWLDEFRAGKNRPAWLAACVPDLQKMLSAPGPAERLPAALTLVAMGQDEIALPVVLEVAKTSPELRPAAPAVLAWLPLEKRQATFKTLLGLLARDQFPALAEGLATLPDARAAPLLWDLLAAPDAKEETAQHVYDPLLKLYFGEHSWSPRFAPADARAEAARLATAKAKSGPEMQRVVGLAVLLAASGPEAAAVAEPIYRAAETVPTLRRDALQVLLLSQSKAAGTKLAVEALAGPDAALRRLALVYLSGSDNALTTLRQGIYLQYDNRELIQSISYGSNQPILVTAPPGLKPELLLPFLAGPDQEAAAYAGYLLATLEDRRGLDALLQHWRRQDKHDRSWRRLSYRAIAALRDHSLVPVLEEMYNGMEKQRWDVREFYWTIRVLSGEKALLLRKRIRDEVGMDQLK